MGPDLHRELAMALSLHRQNRLAEAEKVYTEILRARPHHPEALLRLGMIHAQTRRSEEGVVLIRKAVALEPQNPEAHLHLGNAFYQLSQFEEARESFGRAYTLNPRFFPASLNLAMVLLDLGRWAEALAACDHALALKADLAEAHHNRGTALMGLGRIDEAISAFDQALRLRPGYRKALANQSICLLLKGDYRRGLPQWEARDSLVKVRKRRAYDVPRWTGREDISGKTLFIYHELFLGDMIQLCRYARLAARRGARVVLSAQNSLHALLSGLGEGIELIAEGAAPAHFDYHIPLMSLPLAFGTTPETIPAETGYISAEPERVERWRQRIGNGGFRVGIAWQGSALSVKEGRSIPLGAFAPLQVVPGVRLISLQLGAASEQIAALAPGLAIETLGPDFDSGPQAFLDTAAVIENLDLVITCDSAIAHLCGVLNKPVWVALKHTPDWRWLLGRSDSPWYPSMRLFRQPEPGDWGSVFRQIEAAGRDRPIFLEALKCRP
jgi:tetratricopeptide (TPR) repeat protein